MATEAKQFLDTLNIKVPDSYLKPFHKSGKKLVSNVYFQLTLFSGNNRFKIEDKVKRIYAKIKREYVIKLKQFYQLDFDFFGYGLNVETLEISYQRINEQFTLILTSAL